LSLLSIFLMSISLVSIYFFEMRIGRHGRNNALFFIVAPLLCGLLLDRQYLDPGRSTVVNFFGSSLFHVGKPRHHNAVSSREGRGEKRALITSSHLRVRFS